MKAKTRKIVAKRFRVTKNGVVLRGKQNARHLRSSKSKSQKRKFNVLARVEGPLARAVRNYIQ